MKNRKFFTTRNITYLAVLLAFVILFQTLSSFMTIGNASFCLVLVPIVLGGMIMGAWAGAFLGLAFAIVVLISLLGDPMSMAIMQEHPFFFPFSTLIRGVLAGVVPALVFKLIAKKNKYVATFVAAAVAPIVNTGIFVISMLIMSGTLMNVMGSDYAGMSPIYVILVFIVSFNFFIELGLNIVLSPAIYTVTKVVERRISATAASKEAGKDDYPNNLGDEISRNDKSLSDDENSRGDESSDGDESINSNNNIQG